MARAMARLEPLLPRSSFKTAEELSLSPEESTCTTALVSRVEDRLETYCGESGVSGDRYLKETLLWNDLSTSSTSLFKEDGTVERVGAGSGSLSETTHRASLESMRSNPGDTSSLKASLDRLERIAEGGLAYQEGILFDGGHLVIWDVFTRHVGDSELQLKAVDALVSLSIGSAAARSALTEAGFLGHIGQYLFTANPKDLDPAIVERLGSVMSEIRLGGGAEHFGVECGIDLVLEKWSRQPGNARLSRDGCRAISRHLGLWKSDSPRGDGSVLRCRDPWKEARIDATIEAVLGAMQRHLGVAEVTM